jgi:peptidoglycan/LPS O-acetylase OafA/YrhL
MNKLAVINGLRGLAILAVIAHHAFFDAFKYGWAENSIPLPLDILFSSGWLGVNLFFFLSGFVLYLPFAKGSRGMTTRAELLDFYRRRALRLLPLYTFVWVLSLTFVAGFSLNDPRFYQAALAFITCLFPYHPDYFEPPGNWVMWSLGVEIWFSVLFPILIVAILRYGWRIVIGAVLTLSLAVRLAGHVWTPAEPGTILNFVSDSVIGRLDEFLYGMLAAHLYVARRALPRWTFPLGLLLLGVAMLMWAAWYRQFLPLPATALAVNLLDLGLFLVAMYVLMHRTVLVAVFSNTFLQLAGMMCYSLYLWHGIVRLKFPDSYDAGVLQFATYLLVVLVLSAISYRYIEFAQVRSWRELVPRRESAAIPDPRPTTP